jgi:hypothetical protein
VQLDPKGLVEDEVIRVGLAEPEGELLLPSLQTFVRALP